MLKSKRRSTKTLRKNAWTSEKTSHYKVLVGSLNRLGGQCEGTNLNSILSYPFLFLYFKPHWE